MGIHLTPDQEARIAALAASNGRSTGELVQEAVALWEDQKARRLVARPKRTPAEAASRIRELRKGVRLPAGVTLEELINYGRA
ncbi:MAG: ribbon-helix-helix protein, CopG family [Alphaproteobacteria bacterium]|nr:ribbon-helix-helix protein, CopG family [Alphaproteobacteria bacterium]